MTWQDELKQGFFSPDELLDFLDIEHEAYSNLVHQLFRTRVPLSFAKRMQKGNRDCPLLKQVLPTVLEEFDSPNFSLDPLNEKAFNKHTGILHKYFGRALVLLSTSCAVNCRYCFRRHFPYQDNRLSTKHWQQIIDYILLDQDIHEVILSGGDPLMLTNKKLQHFIYMLETIPHVTTLRIHTRLPVVIPSRIDNGFIEMMVKMRLNVVMVYHINHEKELCEEIKSGVEALRGSGVLILNQSVLLKGVNDKPSELISLSHALWRHGILPYYLHLLDKTQNTAHFDVDDITALELHEAMKSRLPGYLVPKLVREEPGGKNKTWVG